MRRPSNLSSARSSAAARRRAAERRNNWNDILAALREKQANGEALTEYQQDILNRNPEAR